MNQNEDLRTEVQLLIIKDQKYHKTAGNSVYLSVFFIAPQDNSHHSTHYIRKFLHRFALYFKPFEVQKKTKHPSPVLNYCISCYTETAVYFQLIAMDDPH
jgi:hypothetical protein